MRLAEARGSGIFCRRQRNWQGNWRGNFRLAMFAVPRPPCDGPAPSPHHAAQCYRGAAAQDNQSPYAHRRIPYRQQFRMLIMHPNCVAKMARRQRRTGMTLFGDPVISGLRDLTRFSLARQWRNIARACPHVRLVPVLSRALAPLRPLAGGEGGARRGCAGRVRWVARLFETGGSPTSPRPSPPPRAERGIFEPPVWL